ncbi:unnamed protein product [Macrosiphum euphorbiae]|uniref:Uncharacterized protein n=1 Tax=Macrosiphum euphorbiae TaxID=13131 RepID=A0AAV0Y006_9HEMI|nr:unnamed protein product [Macrosiphum euphorbiae]
MPIVELSQGTVKKLFFTRNFLPTITEDCNSVEKHIFSTITISSLIVAQQLLGDSILITKSENDNVLYCGPLQLTGRGPLQCIFNNLGKLPDGNDWKEKK